jgi:uncharacterized protein
MKIIEEQINEKPFNSKALAPYFNNCRVAVADIETTGLSPARNKVILGGILFFEGDRKRMVQVFADSREEEPELLNEYAQQLYQADVVITYNGTGFDIPFIKKRMAQHGMMSGKIDKIYHIDMLRILRRYSDLKNILPDLKQKTVERYFGDDSERTDEISGAESVVLYNEYCASSGHKAEAIRDKILLHNRDDVVRLSNLTKATKLLDVHKIMYCEGWPGVGNITIDSEMLRVDGPDPMIVPAEYLSGHTVVDLIALDLDIPELQKLPGYESGYLDIGTERSINFMEVNALINAMRKKYR